jgi:leucyl/phenylalanyl-tRNA--protein transferase
MDFLLIDCQVHSKHLESLGAINIDRDAFLEHLKKGLSFETMRGSWQFLNE